MSESASLSRPVWVLLGRRTGDNNQLLAVAEALGLPYEVVRLQFRSLSLPNVLLGASTWGIRNPEVLPDGIPRLVLTVGRRGPPVARWIRRRSGGITRLVHFGRPWGPTDWFDLVVTTPQYALPPRPNVVCNLLPFLAPPGPTEVALPDRAMHLPRPWTVLLVGGRSRPYAFDATIAASLADHANRSTAAAAGSLFLIPSPRTPARCVDVMAGRLDVPAYVWRPGSDANPYRTLLGLGDRFIVTSDSALMVAEVLAAGKQLELYQLPIAGDWRYATVDFWARVAEHNAAVDRIFRWLQHLGLIKSTRDLGRYHRALAECGALTTPQVACELAAQEREGTLARIAALLE